MKLITTTEVSIAMKISKRRVQQLCKDFGIGRKLGRDWVLTEKDLDALRGQRGG